MDPAKQISLKLQRLRDRKEQDIDSSYATAAATKDLTIRTEDHTLKLIKAYQKWKTDNDVPGIKY